MLCCMWIWGLNFKMRWWFLTQILGFGSNKMDIFIIWPEFKNKGHFHMIKVNYVLTPPLIPHFKYILSVGNLNGHFNVLEDTYSFTWLEPYTHNERRGVFYVAKLLLLAGEKVFFTFISSRWICSILI